MKLRFGSLRATYRVLTFEQEKNDMKYGIAWLLGIPTTLIVIWFLVNHV